MCVRDYICMYKSIDAFTDVLLLPTDIYAGCLNITRVYQDVYWDENDLFLQNKILSENIYIFLLTTLFSIIGRRKRRHPAKAKLQKYPLSLRQTSFRTWPILLQNILVHLFHLFFTWPFRAICTFRCDSICTFIMFSNTNSFTNSINCSVWHDAWIHLIFCSSISSTLKIFRLVDMTNSVKKAKNFGGLVKRAKVFQGVSQIFA